MAQQVINVGAAPNDHTGDPLRTSFQKCNDNFTELYSGGSGDVAGPASSTDNAVVRFDGTGGKTLQNSSLVVQDNGYFQFLNGSQAVVEFNTSGTSSSGGLTIRASPPHGQQLSITPRSDVNGACVILCGGFGMDGPLGIGAGSAVSNMVTLSNQASGTTRALKIGTGLLNLPVITAPSAPTDGDVWMQSDGLYFRIGGTTRKVTFT